MPLLPQVPDDLRGSLRTLLMLRAGIVPMSPGYVDDDVAAVLKQLPAAEQRRARRRFRKVWRSIARNGRLGFPARFMKQRLGLGVTSPSGLHVILRRRSTIVLFEDEVNRLLRVTEPR